MSARTPRFWAVIPAAGGGARMGAGKPKQYLDLWDRTLLEWSIRPFLEAGWIDGVVLVLARADVEFARLGLSGHPRLLIALGGAARADSVLAGLDVVAARSTGFREVFVLVHDAARPCLEGSDLQRLRDEGSDEHGAILALPVTLFLALCGYALLHDARGQNLYLGAALYEMAEAWPVFYTLHRILSPDGVAILHFH